MSSKRYINQIDKKLDTLRNHWLGLDISFQFFLPRQGSCMTDEEQIRWLTDRMSFMLISSEPWTSIKDADSVWRWLYGSIRYLYETCPTSDQNWGRVLTLVKMDQDLRQSVFSTNDEHLIPLRTTEPPAAFNKIERMVVELIGVQPLRQYIEL